MRMVHDHLGGEWPWRYRAEQRLSLSPNGLVHLLQVTNLSVGIMPAGIGLHPYFPRNDATFYVGRHGVEWQTGDDGLPIDAREASHAVDWWMGGPVSSRDVDTVYAGREGALTIEWLDRGVGLTLSPSHELGHTVVYVPPERDFFCVEPVSHRTNAVHAAGDAGIVFLGTGQTLSGSVTYEAYALQGNRTLSPAEAAITTAPTG